MPRLAHIVAVAFAALALLPDLDRFAPAAAQRAKNPPARDPSMKPGSRVRQLMLKQALEKQVSGTLLAELNQNKKQWGSLRPEQLRNLRNRYYAFLRQDGASQVALLDAAEKYRKLSKEQREAYRERAAWLRRVIANLTPAQREALKKLTPIERAKRLLELKKATLAESQPTSHPQPASTTAK